jgi:hypothetical protein
MLSVESAVKTKEVSVKLSVWCKYREGKHNYVSLDERHHDTTSSLNTK